MRRLQEDIEGFLSSDPYNCERRAVAWLNGQAADRQDGAGVVEGEGVAAQECCQHDLSFRQREDSADSDARPRTKWQIGAARCPGRCLAGEADRIKGYRIRPMLAMTMEHPGGDIDLGSRRDGFV